jgi:hypothetical protein
MRSHGIKTMIITTITAIQINKEIEVGVNIHKVAGIMETRAVIIRIKIQITILRIMEIEAVKRHHHLVEETWS